MTLFSKCLLSTLVIASGYLLTINAQQYTPVPPAPIQVQPYPGTVSQYYYNQNNPYANTTTPYGFYGGFYGSPPPPTPAQAFPDKASSDALYRYIQSR